MCSPPCYACRSGYKQKQLRLHKPTAFDVVASSLCPCGPIAAQVVLGRAGLEQRGWPAPTRHTRLTVTEGLRRARARLRQPAHRPWSPSSRRWGPVIPGARPRSWPSAASDSGELQQAGRRDTTRCFGMRLKVCIGWVASATTPGRRSLQWTSADGRRAWHNCCSRGGAAVASTLSTCLASESRSWTGCSVVELSGVRAPCHWLGSRPLALRAR